VKRDKALPCGEPKSLGLWGAAVGLLYIVGKLSTRATRVQKGSEPTGARFVR
jgi:hypothetical protein